MTEGLPSAFCAYNYLSRALSINARKREEGRRWNPADTLSFPETDLDIVFISKNKFICQAMVRKITFTYLQNGAIKIKDVKEDIVMSN